MAYRKRGHDLGARSGERRGDSDDLQVLPRFPILHPHSRMVSIHRRKFAHRCAASLEFCRSEQWRPARFANFEALLGPKALLVSTGQSPEEWTELKSRLLKKNLSMEGPHVFSVTTYYSLQLLVADFSRESLQSGDPFF